MYPYQQMAPNYPAMNPSADYYAQKAREIAGYGLQIPGISPINMPQTQPGMICRSVTSIDEAKAAMIDAFNVFVFADFANGKIYVKRIENNGAASLQTFTLETDSGNPADYAGQISALEKRIAGLEAKKPGEEAA